MKRAAIYVRVSTDEQRKHGLSVDSQISALTEFCESNGYQIVKIYNDAGHTARKKYTTRPALMRLLADCKLGMFDQVLFTRIDRWFRSVGDYHAIQSVLEDNNVNWKAIWEDYDTETSSGRFKVNIMLSIAEAEADRTAEKIKSVKEYLKEQGRFVGGHIPRGYLFKDGTLIKDEAVQDIIRGFFEHFLTHCNIKQAMLYMNNHGMPLSRQSCVRMLKADYYVGYHNNCKFEPYISEEEHLQILSNLKSHPRNTNKRVYLFAGILRCPVCGGRLGGVPHQNRYTKKNGEVVKKITCAYRCVKNHVSVSCKWTRVVFQSTIEKYLLENLDAIIAQKRIQADLSGSDDSNDTFVAIQKLEAKLSRIGARFEDGDISIDEYRAKRDLIKSEITKLQNSIPTKEKNIPEMPDNWQQLYSDLNDEHKQQFWKRIIQKIEIPVSKDADIKVFFL